MSQHSVVISGTQVSEQTYVPEQKKNGQASAPQELPASIRSALSVLFQAHMYARTLRRDIWEFSLELPNLCATGLSINDLRWLTCMGYVKHAEEIISWRNKRRSFRSYSQLTFTQRTCFVLTPDGIQLARQTLKAGKTGQTQEERLEAVAADEPAAGQESADLTVLDVVPSASAADAPYGVLPHWDVDRRELRMG
ncbi:MAG: hypothetical protein GTO03_07395, partial [Planctomycetales bacterium]|nr:hypothetical protein [Planctomycetales bacterium]